MTIETVKIPKPLKAARNKYLVPRGQWRKWGADGRTTFNWLYGLMMMSPDLFNHPKAIKMNPAHWKTVARNTAWLAAYAVREAVRVTRHEAPRKSARSSHPRT